MCMSSVSKSTYHAILEGLPRSKDASRCSKTRFLDEMARVVNKRIDDGDAYVAMSMR